MAPPFAALDPSTYRPHRLHATERIWSETNCYVDLWIEVLHALGLEPLAGLAFTLSADFEGDQWTFIKFPAEDLRRLYGLRVNELNVWRPLVEHVEEHLELGHFLTVDMDTWFLPDTAGVSYRTQHLKSSIVPASLDRRARQLKYFHNSGFHALAGDDFDGVFRLAEAGQPRGLEPYVEVVRVEGPDARPSDVHGVAAGLAAEHLGRRARANPVAALKKRLLDDVEWLAGTELDTFHAYAFGTLRQCGASAELAADFVDWLERAGVATPAGERFRAVATGAKAVQFSLTRVLRGRRPDLEGPLDAMAEAWDEAMAATASRHG